MKKRILWAIFSLILTVAVASFISFHLGKIVYAEQTGGSPESGIASRIKTLYDDLVVLGYGTDIDVPDWGAFWNRIKTAAKWVPGGDAAVGNVLFGTTFYNNSRTQRTGTMPDNEGDNVSTAQSAAGGINYLTAPAGYYDGNDRVSATNAQVAALAASLLGVNIKEGNTIFGVAGTYPASSSCSTQQYDDKYGPPADQTTNCTVNISWTDPGGGITGTDKQDERTGVIWSYPLRNNAGTIEFSSSTNSTFTWNSSGANNTGRTAAQLCSDRGNSWRLPSQKELMQSYIDGSYFNLNQSFNNFWSMTEAESPATSAYIGGTGGGYTDIMTKGSTFRVRCVR